MTEPPQPPDAGDPAAQPGYPAGPVTPPAYPAQGPAYPYGGQPGWQQPGWQQPGWPQFPAYAAPDLPKATAALVVGIVAVAGAFTCVLPVLAGPVAWVLGVQARREIRRAPGQWGGEGRATAGMVLGIIGTVLLVLIVLLVVLLITLAVTDSSGFDDGTRV
jgi:hypothetical protein